MFVIVWIVGSIAVAIYAQRLHRSSFPWLILSLILSPLLAGLLLLASGPAPVEVISSNLMENVFEESHPDEEDSESSLLLEEGDWVSTATVNKLKMELRLNSHPSDYETCFKEIYQYRIEGNKVHVRLMHKESEDYIGIEEEVQDNVIMLSKIKERYDKSKFTLTPFQERIKNLKKEIQWHELKNLNTAFFIMKQHPNIIPNDELRRIIRTEIERIKFGSSQAFKDMIALEATILKENGFYTFKFPKKYTEEQKQVIEKIVNHTIDKYFITYYELQSSDKMIDELNLHLGLKVKVA